jgi:hypothetical protein
MHVSVSKHDLYVTHSIRQSLGGPILKNALTMEKQFRGLFMTL